MGQGNEKHDPVAIEDPLSPRALAADHLEGETVVIDQNGFS